MMRTDISLTLPGARACGIRRTGLMAGLAFVALLATSGARGEPAVLGHEIRVVRPLWLYPAASAETAPTGTSASVQVAAGRTIRIISECTLQDEAWYFVRVLVVREVVQEKGSYTFYDHVAEGWIKATALTGEHASDANLPRSEVRASGKVSDPVRPAKASTDKVVPPPAIKPPLQIGHMAYAVFDAKWSIGRERDLAAVNTPHLVVELWVRNDSTEARFMPFVGLVDEKNAEYDQIVKGAGTDRMDLTLFRPREERRGTLVFAVPDNHRYRLRVSGGWLSRAKGYLDIPRSTAPGTQAVP